MAVAEIGAEACGGFSSTTLVESRIIDTNCYCFEWPLAYQELCQIMILA
jgi:hypothetical protein